MAKDPEKYRAYMREYMLKRYHRRRQEAIAKLGGKCVWCGAVDRLQLDHVDRATKSFNIARLSSINAVAFWEEVAKCQLLCVPCHEEKTLRDLGQVSAKNTHGTLSSYRYCKCDVCRAGKAAYRRKKLGLLTQLAE